MIRDEEVGAKSANENRSTPRSELLMRGRRTNGHAGMSRWGNGC